MRRLAASLLSCVLAAGGHQPQSGGAPVFRSSSQLVVEVVAVTDKNGKPIEGLKLEDFAVTENGIPQTIRLCEFQKLDEAPPAAPTAMSASGGGAPLTSGQIAPEKPGEMRYRNRRLLALYFDMTAMPVPDQLRALDAARRFVNTQIAAADLVAILEFSDGSVKVRQDFSDNRDQLRATIDQIVAASQGLDEDYDDSTDAAFGQNDSEFNIFNTDRQLSALQTSVNMLGRLTGRKSLIYFASGLRLRGVDNQAQLRATLNAAIRANVSFFPVDARGLQAGAPLGDATAGPPGAGAYTGGAAMIVANNLQRSQDTLYALAADTGGKAMFDYNDLSMGIVQAQKAVSSYYVIGYYTTNSAPDGKFRRISITVKDFPSAKLDYRRGYFAVKEFGKFTAADKERQLEDALMQEDPITDLTIAMEVNFFQLNRAEYYVPVMMKVPGSELVLAQKAGAERTMIDFIGEIKDEYGATIQNIRDKVNVTLSGATAAELMKRHIQYDAGYTLLPGSYTIKVLVRENETGRIGTYLNKFTIPNLNKEAVRIPISSVVLSSQRIDLREALYTAGKDKAQMTNPLVQDGRKLVPSVTRVFSRSRDMYVYLQAYEPDAESPRPLVAFVTFYRGRSKAFETPPLPVTDALKNRLNTVPLKFSIALEKLSAGRYTCQVTVIDPGRQKAAFWHAPVMVVP